MRNVKVILSAMLVASVFTACQKETPAASGESAKLNTELAALNTTNSLAVNSSFTVNWENRTYGSTYTSGQVASDFGNISGWNDSRSSIGNAKNGVGAKVKLLPNELSSDGGIVGNVDISDGSAYEMDYDVKFQSDFNWGKGGKIGFGFKVGEGNTGGDAGWDGNGGSLRIMWYVTDAGRVFFQPYLYYKDQNGGSSSGDPYGDTFDKSYPSSGSLSKGTWYHVHMYIKSNTGSSTNGHAQIIINGTTLLDKDIRWTTNDSQRLIKGLTWHTFRGGSQDYWKVSTTDYIYYDNLTVNKISN